MHLPTPQFSRLVTVLAVDLSNPSLDSMILAWDHIATRYLNRLAPDRALSGRIESIRLLAIHDAVTSIFGPGNGFIFNESSNGSSISAGLAATAQASHDILASAFTSQTDLDDLRDSLEESLSLVSDELEKAVGVATGSASAAAFLQTFGSLATYARPFGTKFRAPAAGGRFYEPGERNQITPGLSGWRRSA